MKREIKFRAWLIKENKMVFVDTISNNKGYGGALEIFVDNPLFDPTKKNWGGNNVPHDTYINHSMEVHKERNNGDDFILMQFTGLKDENGKKIYEGDIVSHFNRMYEVTINFNGYYLQRYKLWRGKFCPSQQYSLSLFTKPDGKVESCEVIGNIYENPELIEKQLSIP